MKKINKGLLIVICSCFLWMESGVGVMLTQAQECVQSNKEITPRADIIDWKYKTIDGQIYCRQYNYTKGQWIGEWEPC